MNPNRHINTWMLLLGISFSHALAADDYGDFLETTIRSDGSKEFLYTITLPEADSPQRGNRPSGSMRMSGGSNRQVSASGGIGYGSGRGGNRSRDPAERQNELLDERLGKKLRKTGYCREGWMELERSFRPPAATIRGECNETATEKDHTNFPNTQD